MTAYQMCIANIALKIRSEENKKAQEKLEGITAFEASIGIAIGFCKSKEEVLMDIVNYKE